LSASPWLCKVRALGADQAEVYEALAEAGIHPDWAGAFGGDQTN
jgi:hypothetical protein